MNPLNAELNPICHLLALVGVRHIVDVSRVRIKVIKLRRVNWDGHVERMWTGEMYADLESGNLKGRDY
jgi:hypothetical protein